MSSADLINNNSEIFRVYSRRLSNPADADIFITSAKKLTNFLSNSKAYYAEAQQPIIDILEVTCNSLKSVAPDVFSTAGFMDRSAIPEDKAPLFEAFVRLIGSVTPYVPHFTDKYLNSRLCLFLSSLGVVLPPGALGGTSADQTPTASSAGNQADSTASQAISSETSNSNIVNPGPTSPPSIPIASINVTTSSSVPSPTQVSSVPLTEMNASATGTVVQSIVNHQTVHFPPSDPCRQPPLTRAPVPGEVVDPISTNPSTHNQISQPPLPSSLPTSSISTKPLSPLSPPQIASPSPHETQPMPSMVSVVTQVQAPAQNRASAPPAVAVSSSGQPKPKPPSRRQSSGLDFLQLDLKVAREKKLRAVAQASPVPVSSPVLPTKVSPPPAATPTPPPTAAPACQPSKAQVPSSSLVHRDLRQGSARNGSSTSPRKLRITSRAPAPALEPGSEGAPIVIDEEEEVPVTAPAEVQMKKEEMTTPVLDSLDVRGSKADPEGQARSEQLPLERASVSDLPSQPPVSKSEPSAIGTLHVSAPSSTSSPLTSVSTPSSVVPASRSPGPATSLNDKPQEALFQQATEGKEIQGETDGKDSMDTHTGTTSAVAEQGKTTEDPVATGQGHSNVYIGSAATIEPPLASESSAPSLGSTQLASAGVMNNNETKLTSSAPPPVANSATESQVTSTTSTAIPAKPGPRLVMDARVHALPQAADVCSSYSSLTELSPTPITGQQAPGIAMVEALPTPANGRPPTPSDGDTRKATAMGVSPDPIPEKQQDPPPHLDAVDSTHPPAIPPHSQPPRENEGSSATVLGSSINNQTPGTSGNASGSTLSVPAMVSHKKVESFNDSRTSPSPPPIAVLGTRTGGSSPTNRSSESRSASPPSGRRSSKAARVDELEDDEMVDELAPLFGKEMKVLCMDRPYEVPGEFVWNLTLLGSDWDKVSLWIKAPKNLDLDISQARCVSLACYSIQDLIPYASQVGMTREQWFENAKPIPWEKLPRNLWVLINDEAAVVFPPYVSSDDLFDVSPFLRRGQNKVCFTQIEGMAEYLFVLHGHHPTRGQLGALHARWDEDRHFQEQLAWFSRPFSIKW